MADIKCRSCGDAHAWHGGAPGCCGSCGRPLVPVVFELTARVLFFVIMGFMFWQARNLPSESGTPVTTLAMFAILGGLLESSEFLLCRVISGGKWALPLGVVFLAALVIMFFLPLPSGVRWYFFGAYIFFKFFASPLAMMPLLK